MNFAEFPSGQVLVDRLHLVMEDCSLFGIYLREGTLISSMINSKDSKDLVKDSKDLYKLESQMAVFANITCLLWIKPHSSGFVWIFEKLDQLLAGFGLNQFRISTCTGSFLQIFGFEQDELLNTDVHLLIPSLASQYATARSKSGAIFPISLSLADNFVQILLYPRLTGSAVINCRLKTITFIDSTFAINMFGLEASLLINTPISNIIPDFWQHFGAPLLSPTQFFPSRHFHSFIGSSRSASMDSGGILTKARHADGNLINVLLKSRSCENLDEIFVSISFTYLHAIKKLLESSNIKDSPICTSPSIPDMINMPIYHPRGDIEDFAIVKDLGEGAFGFVKLGYHKNDPQRSLFVIKYIVKTMIMSWTRNRTYGGRIPTEAAVLIALIDNPHVNIPQLKTSFQDEFYFFLVMPYTHVQDLFDFIESSSEIDESTIKFIFAQVARAVAHLHHLGIVHRDIKVYDFKQG
jgi:hypothetical protein